MPFVKLDMSKGQESENVPEGVYPLRIVKVDDGVKSERTGRDMTIVTIRNESPEHPNASTIRHYITYPMAGDKPETIDLMTRNIKRFCHVFGIPMIEDGFDTDDLDGATGECMIGLTEPNDNGDVFNELRLPRMPKEGHGADAAAKPGAKRPLRRPGA